MAYRKKLGRTKAHNVKTMLRDLTSESYHQ